MINRNSKQYKISRYLWEQKNGPIPKGLLVCHKCDNRACINLEHFFLGTQLENMKDMVFKNRQLKGEEKSLNKLTEQQVLQIRQEKGTDRDVAKKYKISFSVVNRIRNRKIWKWL